LHNGLDFSTPLNRTRASGLFAPVFERFAGAVKDLLNSIPGWAGKGIWIDSVTWVGGGGCVGLGANAISTLVATGIASEDIKDEVIGAPEEVLARGAALHALNLINLPEEFRIDAQDVRVTTKTIGVIIPSIESAEENELGGQWVPVLVSETALPARRTVRFAVEAAGDAFPSSLPLEIWETSEAVKVKVIPAEVYSDAEDDEEPAEPTEEHERGIKKEAYLGSLEVPLSTPRPVKKGKKSGKNMEVKIGVALDGAVEVVAREDGKEDWVRLALAAPSA